VATLILVLLGLVAVVTYWRRLARRGALQLPKDVITSAILLCRAAYWLIRFYIRLLLGEVRSW
jgi:hypothetical protein